MKWLNVKSVDELKKLGTLQGVTKQVEEDCKGIINVKLDNWDSLFESIQLIKSVIKQMDEREKRFTSKGSEYIFYLTELEGKERKDKLQVRSRLYANRRMAEQWKNKIEQEIISEELDSFVVQKAISVLNQLYLDMIAI